jgi:hypothetical protein
MSQRREQSIEFIRHHQDRIGREPLIAVQNFTRFLSTHRQSTDLEAEIRTDLRREGFAGAIEIIMHHEAREIGE